MLHIPHASTAHGALSKEHVSSVVAALDTRLREASTAADEMRNKNRQADDQASRTVDQVS